MDAMSVSFERTQSVAIIGGGPGGYEAALAAAQLGAEVTVVERAGIGGSAVITDVVPSKTLIATADAAVAIAGASDLGVQLFAKGKEGKPLKPEVIDSAWANLTFTDDPIASSLIGSAEDAVAVGLLDPVDNLEGIYDLSILNQVLAAAGQPEVSQL